ncbi:N-acetyl sugar amidotransferase [Spartinivicinus marinus]|uniref:N-acetyl sugar amidotransferase n=1 Tax=Spartinivicinus marinus TaxID=2994442 RepID=UPI00224F998A|nr:N-acetyl sugar amidotransferase [Spartinivicinus marinus]
MIKYCIKCLMPDTKPDLLFNEGICNACINYNTRERIDWDQRKKELIQIIDKYKNNKKWDCIIPVSGGKDSTYQVIQLLKLGVNPLCVTSTTCDLSDIGRRNIENIKNLGVDYVEFSPNPIIRRKLNHIGLTQVGDISWPEHVGIFTIPVRAAVQYNVPLIIWGENSQNEYGGPASAVENNTLDRSWLEEFGGLLGLRVSDVVGIDGIEQKHLVAYTYPSNEELTAVGVTGLFLGYYIPWDGYSNALLAQAYGFETLHWAVEGSAVNYENLDNYQTGIHDYFKYLKFGFGRATDITCLHIRRGRVSREDGLQIVQKNDGKFPWTYLGKSLEDILKPLNISLDQFIKICDQFTNKKIFKMDRRGNLVKDNEGNLIKLNYDNI